MKYLLTRIRAWFKNRRQPRIIMENCTLSFDPDKLIDLSKIKYGKFEFKNCKIVARQATSNNGPVEAFVGFVRQTGGQIIGVDLPGALEAARREDAKEMREAAQTAHDHLMNLQPHIAQLEPYQRPFIDSHVDLAMEVLSTALKCGQEEDVKV